MITLPNLDTEQQKAQDQLVAEYATQTGDSQTTTTWGEAVLMGLINERKVQNIDAEGAQLISLAKQLPDANRLAFTEDVKAALVANTPAP